MTTQTWNTGGYQKNARFVTDLGAPVLELLAPKRVVERRMKDDLIEELNRRGYDGKAANPWYFPTAEDYGARRAAAGFEVRYIALIPRPTPLPDAMGWLKTFCGCFAAVRPPAEREQYLECVRKRAEPDLCDVDGNWTADYVRLRFEARLR